MPYVEGETLRERLRREGQLPVDDALRIAWQAATRWSTPIAHDVVHRDIKPENMLLTTDGQVLRGRLRNCAGVGGADAAITETGSAWGRPPT